MVERSQNTEAMVSQDPLAVTESSPPASSTTVSHYGPHLSSVIPLWALCMGGNVLTAEELQGWPLWEEVSGSATDLLQNTAGQSWWCLWERMCKAGKEIPDRENREQKE